MSNSSNALVKIHSFATLMCERNENKEPTYVLVLGAGASLASGASSISQILDAIIKDHTGLDPDSLPKEQKLDYFYKILDSISFEERNLILSRHLKGVEPSFGYRHLANLVKMGYFDLILTTNFDLFLENALMDVGMRAQEFMVLINGQDNEIQIIKSLKYKTPRVKIFKLHGDLNTRIFAFTPDEIFQFSEKIEGVLTEILNGDIVVVGHSMRDDDLNRCIKSEGGALWYVNPNEPSVSNFAGRAIRARGTHDHFISGDWGKFDAFLTWLSLEIILPRFTQVADTEERHLLQELHKQRTRGDLLNLAVTLESLAKFYDRSQREKAELYYEQSAALFEMYNDALGAARVLRSLGTFHAHLNRPEQALHCYCRSRDLCQKANNPQGLAQSLSMIGQYWRAVHKFEKAISYWEKAMNVPDGLTKKERERVTRWLNEAKQKLRDVN